jgi:hypothetical protein
VEATFDPVMDTIAKQHGIKIPDDLRDRARRLIAEHSATVVRAMIEGGAADQAARVYARYFTAEELEQLREFQTHPVVIKANRLAPGLMAELGQIGTVTATEHSIELISKLKSMMQAWLEEQQAAERDPA